MKKEEKRGFTLIELLVVILIIGILAAVALPQYQKAVEKARLAEALTVISSLQRAAEAWYYETGGSEQEIDFLGKDATEKLPLDLSALDCSASTSCKSKNFEYKLSWDGAEYPYFVIFVTRNQNSVTRYVLIVSEFPQSPWDKICDVTEGGWIQQGDLTPWAQAICKSLETQGWRYQD